MAEDSDFETCVRQTWRRLVGRTLPEAARRHGWSVATPSGFTRVLLDHVYGGPWEARAGTEGPGTIELVLAIEAGERVLARQADLREMNRRSLAGRAAPLDDAELAALLCEDGAEPDDVAAMAGLSAADLVARICEEAARRRRSGGSF